MYKSHTEDSKKYACCDNAEMLTSIDPYLHIIGKIMFHLK